MNHFPAELTTIRVCARYPRCDVTFPVDSRYVAQVWAGVLGPSSLALLRHLAFELSDCDPLEVDVTELARTIGVTSGKARQSLGRLVDFHVGIARPSGLEIYVELPPVGRGALARLSLSAVWCHTREMRIVEYAP